jgi:hypothetical protein
MTTNIGTDLYSVWYSTEQTFSDFCTVSIISNYVYCKLASVQGCYHLGMFFQNFALILKNIFQLSYKGENYSYLKLKRKKTDFYMGSYFS